MLLAPSPVSLLGSAYQLIGIAGGLHDFPADAGAAAAATAAAAAATAAARAAAAAAAAAAATAAEEAGEIYAVAADQL